MAAEILNLDHDDHELWCAASAAIESRETSDATKQLALTIRTQLRLQSRINELLNACQKALDYFGPAVGGDWMSAEGEEVIELLRQATKPQTTK